MYSQEKILFAFCMTLLAGLATGIGSLLALFPMKKEQRFLAFALGFSAGVMIYISLVELLPSGIEYLEKTYSQRMANIIGLIAFFGGMLCVAIIDKLLPEHKTADDAIDVTLNDKTKKGDKKLLHTGIITALAIGIHNFPEGLASFISALSEPNIAIPIIVAIALHNIPEGLAVSAPIYYATKSKKKAFILSFLSGLAEPFGAFIGYLILMPFMTNEVFGVIFAVIAGIMVYISFSELLPSTFERGNKTTATVGICGGMAIMGISLVIFM